MVIREAIQILLHERDWLTLSIYVSLLRSNATYSPPPLFASFRPHEHLLVEGHNAVVRPLCPHTRL